MLLWYLALRGELLSSSSVLRAICINCFDSYPYYVRGIISGSTEIVPGEWGGVTFQEIAIVFLQLHCGPGFSIHFLEFSTWVGTLEDCRNAF